VKKIKLSVLPKSEEAIITSIHIDSREVALRLSDLGLKIGQKITCLNKSPVGGVTSFQLSHGVFALEDSITNKIFVAKSSV